MKPTELDSIVSFLNSNRSKWPDWFVTSMQLEDCNLIDNTWKTFKSLADHDYLGQLIENPYKKWWEFCVCHNLIELGFQPTKSFGSGGSPDFLVEIGGRRVWIEAVCPGWGDTPKSDYLPTAGEAHWRPTGPLKLRVANAIDEKNRKFAKYREHGIVKDTDAIVVAISVGEIDPDPSPHLEYDTILTALYPIGAETFKISVGDGVPPQIVGSGFQREIDIRKPLREPTTKNSLFGADAILYGSIVPFRPMSSTSYQLSLGRLTSGRLPSEFGPWTNEWQVVSTCADSLELQINNAQGKNRIRFPYLKS